MTTHNSDKGDDFIEGFHDIPSADEIASMSFVRLASELSTCKPSSAKYLVLENALLRHRDTDKIQAAKFGAIVSAIAAIVGAVVGAVLTATLSSLHSPQVIQCQCGGAGYSQNQEPVTSPKPPAQVPVIQPTKPINIAPATGGTEHRSANGK